MIGVRRYQAPLLYVFSERMFPPLYKIFSLETCLGSVEPCSKAQINPQIGITDCQVVIQLRGGSVGMLLILQPDDVPFNTEDEKHVIFTLQPRIPAGSLSLAELPAGMLDDAGTFAGGAAKEIEEETGLKVPASELINMTELALSSATADHEEHLQKGVYPSPGGCDEFVTIFLWQKRIPREQMKEWQGKLTGLRAHGEKITLMLCPLEKVWRQGVRDAKVLSGWALYEGLRREGKL